MVIYSESKESEWDLDVVNGEGIEREFGNLLLSTPFKIEVKAEFRHWQRTRNFAVEYAKYGKPVGLYATKSEYFVIAFVGGDDKPTKFFMTNTEEFKEWIEVNRGMFKNIWMGDNKATQGYLIPIKYIVHYLLNENV